MRWSDSATRSATKTPAASPVLAALAKLEHKLALVHVFAVLGTVLFLIAWNRGVVLLYALFALWMGVIFISLIGARWMLRPANIKLGLPATVCVGDKFMIPIEISTHVQPHKRFLLSLKSPYPFAPGQALFLSQCGAGLMRYQTVVATQRGVFSLQETPVTCAYPLGLFSLTRNWRVTPSADITVYPRSYDVHRFVSSANSQRISGDQDRRTVFQGQELFREVRDYRRGDNWRHIHWRSSARQQRLIVKEFDTIATTESWIVLDMNPANHAGYGQHHTFERALEIAASLAVHLLRSGQRCGLVGGLKPDGATSLYLPPKAGGTHLQAVLYALAEAKMDSTADYAETLNTLFTNHQRQQQWVLFDHDASDTRVHNFLKHETGIVWFHFDTASFTAVTSPDRRELQAAKRIGNHYYVSRTTDFENMFK